MSIHKFEREDVIRSVVKAQPKVMFKIYKGRVYTNTEDTEDMRFSPTCEVPHAFYFVCDENSYNIVLL